MWLKLLSVFGLGMVGLWESVPAGFLMQLHPLAIGVLSALGSLTSTLLVLMVGDRLRSRLLRRKAPIDGAPPPERYIDRVWRRYGVIGLGLLAPGITGAPIGVALGLSLRAPTRKLLIWSGAGIILWSVGLTLSGMAGTAGILRLFGR